MNLSQLKPGQQAEVLEVNSGKSSLRLLELGFVPGALIRVHSLAPLGDPMAVEVDSALVSLRKEDAAVIQIQSTNQASS
jgi:ferrous iron transport protein A